MERFASGRAGPQEVLERKEARRLVYQALDQMSEKQRSAFVLFELEGYSGEEIAQLLQIPVATVWTRPHHGARSSSRGSTSFTARRPPDAAALGSAGRGRSGGGGGGPPAP